MIDTLNVTCLDKCLCCQRHNLVTVLDLKTQPLANSYLKDSSEKEFSYPLALNYCNDCSHLQLTHAVNPDLLFKNYLYVSGTTQTLRDYFDRFVKITSVYLPNLDKYNVLDIACNDGSQLDVYKKYGHNTYGIDPAENLYHLSSKNHKVICDYFTQSSIDKLDIDSFDVIIAQNVFAHNFYPDEFLKVCRSKLSINGKLFVQTSQSDMVKYGQFDTIYHEHISFFNIHSMYHLAKRTGMYLEDVLKTDIHGTSYVFVLSSDSKNDNSKLLLINEPKQTLEDAKLFAERALRTVINLKEELNKYKNCYIVGYGAAAKGNTVLNFGDINLDYIIDDNTLKQGMYTPGRKIKIISLDEMLDKAGDRDIVWVPLSWNFFDEIRKRVKEKYDKPTTFIKYFPELKIVI